MDGRHQMIKKIIIFMLFTALAFTARAADENMRRYFDMPVTEWQKLPDNARKQATFLLLSNKKPTEQQVNSVNDCMEVIGKSPTWQKATLGTLVSKCSMDMGVVKSASDERWDAAVACIKKDVPDFTKEEFFSVTFSALGAATAKDAQPNPPMTPRTQKIMEATKKCGG